MAIVKPFAGIRPAKEVAKKVCSLPYDVMNRKEARSMVEGNPVSFLHISRSEIDLDDRTNPYSEEVYKKANFNLEKFIEEGTLIVEDRPKYYIYRQKFLGNFQTGIVACVSIDEYEKNKIKKHELTRVEKEEDRIKHFDYCNANTEPIFLTYRDNKKIDVLIEGYLASHQAEYDFEDDHKVAHTLWAINDEELVKRIETLFAEVPALYIADGHHRSASAYKVGLKRRQENPDYKGDEEFNFFMAAIFPDNQLKIMDYNRVVKDLNGLSNEEFLNKIQEAGFEIEELTGTDIAPTKKHQFSMFLEGKWYRLNAKAEIIPEDFIQALDASVLQNKLLHPILAIEDPRRDKRIDFVGGIRGLKELERRAKEDMKVAFALYPVTMADLLKVADDNEIMPPKTTWFEPKLGSGLFVHKL